MMREKVVERINKPNSYKTRNKSNSKPNGTKGDILSTAIKSMLGGSKMGEPKIFSPLETLQNGYSGFQISSNCSNFERRKARVLRSKSNTVYGEENHKFVENHSKMSNFEYLYKKEIDYRNEVMKSKSSFSGDSMMKERVKSFKSSTNCKIFHKVKKSKTGLLARIYKKKGKLGHNQSCSSTRPDSMIKEKKSCKLESSAPLNLKIDIETQGSSRPAQKDRPPRKKDTSQKLNICVGDTGNNIQSTVNTPTSVGAEESFTNCVKPDLATLHENYLKNLLKDKMPSRSPNINSLDSRELTLFLAASRTSSFYRSNQQDEATDSPDEKTPTKFK
ncbi:unnamed protein product [Moneuplotes crassus]|uniref:Uncharacterized protein n=1 Tax=Euplotes crassus TaxID=5936 RepID=A0AAD1XBN9_EUPCR|nr:unnamed protein product [Moneuplotes crassus]